MLNLNSLLFVLMIAKGLIIHILRSMFFQEFHNDFVCHTIVSNQTLPRVLGHIPTAYNRAQIRGLGGYLFGQGLFVMPVT